MSNYHEPVEELQQQTRDFTRALNSIKEELEAVDWYQQRAATTQDPDLKAVIEHNRDEEIEHACMVLEWLRRNMPAWDEQLRTYLFTSAPITEIEEVPGESDQTSPESKGAKSGSLNIGRLR